MSGPSSEDETILPATVLDDPAGAATRLDPVPGQVATPGAAVAAGPAAGQASEGATILGTMAVPADATVFVDDRVGAFDADERAATVLDAADAATLLDPNVGRRARQVPTTGDATAVPTSPPPASDGAASVGVPPPNVRYVLETIAGRGGMGTVHVARDVELLRKVALKELSLDVAHDRSARSRFVREVQVTAQLDHPHIVPVYSLEVASGGRPAYAMKLVEGQTFTQLIADTRAFYEKKGKPDDDHALPARLEHFLKVCDAIGYAHERGVVHRDLKPANLMVGRHNEVYVMDWGICRLMAQAPDAAPAPTPVSGATGEAAARAGSTTRAAVSLEASHAETAYGAIVGTPLYMSPEQATGRHDELDAKSDQCALGLILFELVALKRPINGKTIADVLAQASAGTRAPFAHAFGEPIPGELGAIVAKASAKAPADRYATVADFADDLRRFMRGDAVLARPDSAWQRGVRWLGRHRQVAALSLLGLIITSLAGAAFLLYRQERALQAQERRDRQIERLVSAVGEQGDRFQINVLEIHDALDMAVAAIGHAFEYGRPTTEPILWDGASHDSTIGFDVAPGLSRAALEGEARRVATVHAAITRVLDAVRQHLGHGSGAARGHQVDAADTGLHELRAGLASGLKFTVPAAALERTAADMRVTPWYQAASDGKMFHWGLINHDNDAEMELALSAPIVGDSGRQLGAAGLVVSLDHALANLVASRPVPNAKLTLLFDSEGNLLASHSAAGGQGGGAGLVKLLNKADIQTLVKNDVGFIETDRLGGPHIMAYDTIDPMKWTLVTIAETDAVIGAK